MKWYLFVRAGIKRKKKSRSIQEPTGNVNVAVHHPVQ